MEKTKISIKNIDMVKIWKTLQKIEGVTTGSAEFKFGLAIDKNVMKPLVDAIDLANPKPSKEIDEYSAKYHDLLKEHEAMTIPDEEGNSLPIEAARMLAERAIIVLNEEFKDAIEERKTQLVDFENLLNAVVELDLYKLPQEDLLGAFNAIDPKNVTTEDFSNLIPLI